MISKICIAGINGYTGQLLKELISKHPNFELAGSLGISKQENKEYTYSLDELSAENFDVDFLLLATPAEISIEILQKLYEKNIKTKVLDLSGAFRLDKGLLASWYGLSHSIEGIEQGAKYGLSPYVKFTQQDTIIANPGCYATCALLSLLPLLKHNLIKPNNIIIDAKSGVSGAGKKPRQDLMFSEMLNNFFPYKIGKHRHIPEILKALTEFDIKEDELYFNTNMLPIHSGIAMTIYADLNLESTTSEENISDLVSDAYNKEYAEYPLFKLIDIAAETDSTDTEVSSFLSIKSIVGTPNTHLGFSIKNNKIIVFSFIDNLFKGAVTQAIENLNNYYGLPITTGL
ncbi:N-acetyl-gamma-glutamyl-phosphate reductase [Francisella philomiragia]|uniref:N-acetyl-gamma-glutamyl-phosphate reductase n=1 Tax=Francisella philomiragia TaxID=28110 RepID=A0ABS1GEB5_9GAMM|nr:N-acetyl-gamma-glutamyl-phosphate reductase [Francisella philomiragia]MBK2259449.1 N-acetyl-gamma-glutamyl-phosphate reductase [Francisella philomiragia]MBK2303023.1 N-acetyl-gamma-glutamyl-phosphate reductase [Francisella philomiragia]